MTLTMCRLFAVSVALIGSFSAAVAIAEDGGPWNAFAMQIEPVEGKNRDKNRDKNRRDDDAQPNSGPHPAPMPEHGDNTEPVDKNAKPTPSPKPRAPEGDNQGRNRDSHNTTIIDRTVYRTSFLPSIYDLLACGWLFILTVYVCRRLGLDLGSLCVWRK